MIKPGTAEFAPSIVNDASQPASAAKAEAPVASMLDMSLRDARALSRGEAPFDEARKNRCSSRDFTCQSLYPEVG